MSKKFPKINVKFHFNIITHNQPNVKFHFYKGFLIAMKG